jgi:hypothetical protein
MLFNSSGAGGSVVSTKMIIDGSGNVGIGTTAPSRKLHVIGSEWNNSSGGGVVFENSNSVGASLTLKPTASNVTNGTNGWAVYSGGPGAAIGDGNFGFWAHGTNAARMVITRAGNVGIGTTAPGTKLHISAAGGSAQLTLERTGGGAGKVVLAGAADGLIVYDDVYGAKMYVGTSGTYNGSVGIGTTTPSNKLDINSGAANSALRVLSTDRYTGIKFQDSLDADTLFYDGQSNLMYLSDTNFRAVNLYATGNVGIGTTSPSNKLSLAGSGQNWNTSPAIKMWDSYNSKGWYVGSANNANTGDFYIRSVTAEDAYPVDAGQEFVIKQSGSVGIGTKNPSGKFEVNTGSSAAYFTRTASDDGVLNPVIAIATDSSRALIAGSGSSLDFRVKAVGTSNPLGGSTMMSIQSSGNVGIGTTAPSAKLEVAGTIKHQGIVPSEGTNIDQIKTVDTTLQLTADTWVDTGIDGSDLSTGTYVLQVYVEDFSVSGGHYYEFYSGIISWYSGNTNSDVVDEIVLHRAGHAPNTAHIQLRVERAFYADSHDLMLQIKSNRTHTAAMNGASGKTIRFKFRRLI